jgi:hypothetical protein
VARAVIGLVVELITAVGRVRTQRPSPTWAPNPAGLPPCRTAASACVVGWGTAGAVGPLRAPVGWPLLSAAAVAGAGATVTLRVRPVLQQRHEAREAVDTGRHWTPAGPGTTAASTRTGTPSPESSMPV